MCDHSLGRVLDVMDGHDLWDDTMLIVNTDHGFLLGEHGWWAKSVQPWYDELVHLPLFIWDPRSRASGARAATRWSRPSTSPRRCWGSSASSPRPTCRGATSPQVLAARPAVRDGALFGIHGGHVNVTDGRYVYMRAPDDRGERARCTSTR